MANLSSPVCDFRSRQSVQCKQNRNQNKVFDKLSEPNTLFRLRFRLGWQTKWELKSHLAELKLAIENQELEKLALCEYVLSSLII